MTGDGSLDCLLGCGNGTVSFFENVGTTGLPIWDLVSHDFFGYNVGQLASPWCGELFVEDRIDCLVGALDGRVHFFERTGDAFTPTYSHSNDDVLQSVISTDTYISYTSQPRTIYLLSPRSAAAPFCGKFRKKDTYMSCMVGTASGKVQYFTQTKDLADVGHECVQDNPILVQGSQRWFILTESSMFSDNYAYSMPSCGADLNDDEQLDCFVGNANGITTVQLSTGGKALAYNLVVSSPRSTMSLFGGSERSWSPSSSPTHLPSAALPAPTSDPTHLPSAAAARNVSTSIPTHSPTERNCEALSSGHVMPSEGSEFLSPWCGDLDGDGDLDCLVGTGGGSVSVYTNQGVSCSSVTSKLGKGNRCDPIAQGGFALTFVRKRKWKCRKCSEAKKKHKRGLRLYGKSFDDQTGFEQVSYSFFTRKTEHVVLPGSQTARNVCLLAMFGDSYTTTTTASDGVTPVFPMTPTLKSHAVLARKRKACVHFYGGTSGEYGTPQPTHSPTTESTPNAGLCTIDTSDNNTCYSSPNYPSFYGNSQSCSFSIPIDGVLDVVAFNTQSYYDSFVVHGISYSGTVGPSNVAVSAGNRISWSSDASVVSSGFKICVVAPETPPPTHMPTSNVSLLTQSAAVCHSTEHSALSPNVKKDAKKFTIGNTCDPCQSVRKHSKTRKGKARCWKRVFCYMDASLSNSSSNGTADMENQVGQCGATLTTRKKAASRAGAVRQVWLVISILLGVLFVLFLLSHKKKSEQGSTSFPARYASERMRELMDIMPAYWERDGVVLSDEGFAVYSIPKFAPEWNSLRACLAATRGDWLGRGRDVRRVRAYDSLELCKAWRIENGFLWGKYHDAQERIANEMTRVKGQQPTELRVLDNGNTLYAHTESLPGRLRHNLNECYLLHGTKPEVVMDLIKRGLDVHFSKRGAFGDGNYFAEDAGKSDQYVVADPGFKRNADVDSLHDALYQDDYPDEEIFYLVLCRVTMGAYVRTRPTSLGGALKQLDRPSEYVFPDRDRTREMPLISRVSPPTRYHGLVVESRDVGGSGMRYREFVSFHNEYSYPEYILAYKRTRSW